MSGNISQFLEHIKDSGIAKTSHFDVVFTMPPILRGDPDTPRLLAVRCESAELPGRQIATTDNKIYGPIYKIPYQTIYSEMTMTFVETADMDIRSFFEKWVSGIYDAETNIIGYVDDFVADIFVTQYALEGTPDQLKPTLRFQLIRAFPTNINQLTTSWGDDSPHKLSVTFFYERYVIRTNIPSDPLATLQSLKPLVDRYAGNVEYPEDETVNDEQINGMERAKSLAEDYMVEYPENETFNDEQMNGMERAKSLAEDYMVEYPEDQKNNDIKINSTQYANGILAQSQRKDEGLLGGIISDLKTKVMGSK